MILIRTVLLVNMETKKNNKFKMADMVQVTELMRKHRFKMADLKS